MAEDNRIYLFDSTLRDGAQTQGVDFSVADKTAMARALDGIGIDYVEGGWPGANPTDNAFFREPPKLTRANWLDRVLENTGSTPGVRIAPKCVKTNVSNLVRKGTRSNEPELHGYGGNRAGLGLAKDVPCCLVSFFVHLSLPSAHACPSAWT